MGEFCTLRVRKFVWGFALFGDKGVVYMSMVGKTFKVAIGTRESLKKIDKILQQVDCYIDGESGTLYIVLQEEELGIETNIFLKDSKKPFEIFI